MPQLRAGLLLLRLALLAAVEAEDDLEPARQEVSFVGLALAGALLAGAIGAGCTRLQRYLRQQNRIHDVVPIGNAINFLERKTGIDIDGDGDVGEAEADAVAKAEEAAQDAQFVIEMAMMMADHSSRLPPNVRQMLREGTHADLEMLMAPGATTMVEDVEDVEDLGADSDDLDDDEIAELRREIGLDALDDEFGLPDAEQDVRAARRRFGDPLLRSRLARDFLLYPDEDQEALAVKMAPGHAMEIHLGRLQTVELEKLKQSIHGLGDGMDVLVEGPLQKLARVANIQCWIVTYVRVWVDGRCMEFDDFVKTEEQEAPELNAAPSTVTQVFEVVASADPATIPADTENHDAVLTITGGKRGKSAQVYLAADATKATYWVAGCETLAKTSTLPQPALMKFLEEHSLGDFATKLAELAKIRTVDQLAITPVSDTTLLLAGMNRFKQRIYRRAVREAYKTQSSAASKAASADIPTIYQEKEADEARHEEAKKKIKVVEKGAAKKRKEKASDTQTLEALGTRLRYDVEPFGLIELRKLQGATDAQIERDAEEQVRQQEREAEKLAKQAKVAESGTLRAFYIEESSFSIEEC